MKLAALPSVDKLLQHPALQAAQAAHGKTACTEAIRAVLAQLRSAVRAEDGALDAARLAPEAMAQAVGSALAQRFAPQLRAVFNLSGTVLHTNLGRALLPPEAIESVVQAMAAPMNLEYDLASGGRGSGGLQRGCAKAEKVKRGGAELLQYNAADATTLQPPVRRAFLCGGAIG